MNFFKGVSLVNIPRISSIGITQPVRYFSITSPIFARKTYDRYYKITKQLTSIDKRDYQPGQERPKYMSVPKEMPKFPRYDYETRFFKSQNRGLYGGLQRKSSKKCSEFLNKTLRSHKPNAVWTKLWSETLNKKLRLKVAVKVLKTISKEGGLDAYLLKSTPGRIKTMGLKAWQLRYELLQAQEQKERGTVTLLDDQVKPVTYIHSNGLKFHATKEELLDELHEAVQRDSYYPIKLIHFERRYSWWSTKQIVDKLEQYKWDFSKFAQ